jgi:hypothetical protein
METEIAIDGLCRRGVPVTVFVERTDREAARPPHPDPLPHMRVGEGGTKRSLKECVHVLADTHARSFPLPHSLSPTCVWERGLQSEV